MIWGDFSIFIITHLCVLSKYEIPDVRVTATEILSLLFFSPTLSGPSEERWPSKDLTLYFTPLLLQEFNLVSNQTEHVYLDQMNYEGTFATLNFHSRLGMNQSVDGKAL